MASPREINVRVRWVLDDPTPQLNAVKAKFGTALGPVVDTTALRQAQAAIDQFVTQTTGGLERLTQAFERFQFGPGGRRTLGRRGQRPDDVAQAIQGMFGDAPVAQPRARAGGPTPPPPAKPVMDEWEKYANLLARLAARLDANLRRAQAAIDVEGNYAKALRITQTAFENYIAAGGMMQRQDENLLRLRERQVAIEQRRTAELRAAAQARVGTGPNAVAELERAAARFRQAAEIQQARQAAGLPFVRQRDITAADFARLEQTAKRFGQSLDDPAALNTMKLNAAMVQLGRQAVETSSRMTGFLGIISRLIGGDVSVERLLRWSIGWSLAYQALNLVIGAVTTLTVGALQRLIQFQEQQIALAAEFVNLNPSMPFDMAAEAAGRFLNALIRLQPGFVGTQAQLREILVGTVRYFGQIDLTTEVSRRQFLAVANAIILSTQGILRQGQALQELRAISEGVVRPGAQLLTILQRQDRQLNANLALWVAQGTVIANMAQLLVGYEKAVDRIGATLGGQLRRLQANIEFMLRSIGQLEGGPLAGVVRFFNRLLESFGGAGGQLLGAAAAGGLANVIINRVIVPALVRAGVGAAAGTVLGGPAGTVIGGAVGLLAFLLQARAILTQLRKDAAVPLEFKIATNRVVIEEYSKLFDSVDGLGKLLKSRSIDFGAYQQGLQALFATGVIGSQEFANALSEAERILLDMASKASGEAQQALTETFLRARRAAADFRRELEQRTRRERRVFEELDIPESESRLRASATESLGIKLRELDVQREISRSRVDELESRKLATKDESRLLEIDKEVRRESEKQADLLRQSVELRRQILRTQADLQSQLFRAGGMDVAGRLIELRQRLREQLEAAKGIAGLEEQTIRTFVFELGALLKQAAEGFQQARREFADALIQAIQAPLDIRRLAAELRIEGIGIPEREETEAQVRQRLGRVIAEQARLNEQQVQAARRQLDIARQSGSPELLIQRAMELNSALREQVRVRTQLVLQMQEEARAARQRDLDAEIRRLERLQEIRGRQIGPRAGTDVFGEDVFQRRLRLAREERELRELTPRALQEELDLTDQMRRNPAAFGLSAQEVRDLKDRSDIISRLIAEEQKAAQQRAQARQQTEATAKTIEASIKEVEGAVARITAKTLLSASLAIGEYQRLFDYIIQTGPKWVDFFRRLGLDSGSAFFQSFLKHFGKSFPAPTPGAPLPSRQQGGPITQTGPHLLHQGEFVLPKGFDERFVPILNALVGRLPQGRLRSILSVIFPPEGITLSQAAFGFAGPITLQSKALGRLFHGGPSPIDQIDPAKLQIRDPGFFGRGFYATQNPLYAKLYGHHVSQFEAKPTALILDAPKRLAEASSELIEVIGKFMRDIGEGRGWRGSADTIRANVDPAEWIRALNRFAEAKKYDIIRFTGGGTNEVLIKNIKAIEALGPWFDRIAPDRLSALLAYINKGTLPTKQFGGPIIESGPHMLHRGEFVLSREMLTNLRTPAQTTIYQINGVDVSGRLSESAKSEIRAIMRDEVPKGILTPQAERTAQRATEKSYQSAL